MVWIALTFLFALISIVLLLVFYYNRFQTLKNASYGAFEQVKVALKRRLDTVTQMLENLQSTANFEREILEKILETRRTLMRVKNTEDLSKEIVNLLSNFRFLLENYPELKSPEMAKELNKAIFELEEEISRQRYFFNSVVQEYNTLIDTFPSNLVAKLFNFHRLKYLEIPEKEIQKGPSLKWN